MTFSDVVRKILASTGIPMTPQEIRDRVIKEYPEFYGTPSHLRNVRKGYYKDISHALLARIYSLVKTGKAFKCEKNVKPMKILLRDQTSTSPHYARISFKSLNLQNRSLRTISYENKVLEILQNAERYHHTYYKAKTFGGPSLYFHQRALETRQTPDSLIHLEYVYATLASWGMHRMGKDKGAKMHSFETFYQSIKPILGKIIEAQRFNFREMDDPKWSILKEIFQGIVVMASGTSLVGNSKVMHHMLPNIVPPIDRSYTLYYLQGNTNIANSVDHEWQLMKRIISSFFIPIASNNDFEIKARHWIKEKDQYPWDTSVIKVIDNLVIGAKNK